MPETNFLILGAIQLFFLFVYRWIGKAYIFQSRANHPAIFWNPIFATILCMAPTVGLIGTIIVAFIILTSPWWFTLATFIGFLAFSTGIKTQPTSVDETYYWLSEHKIDTDNIRYNVYTDNDLAHNPGATVVVGIGMNAQNEKIGFAVEILPGKGVITGEIIEPYGIVTHHKAAAHAARQHGTYLIDALIFLARQHQAEYRK